MTPNPRLKSSSRAGRFKKKLIAEDELVQEGPLLAERIAPTLKLFTEGEISEAELVSLFLLATLSLRFPGTWAGARRPSLEIPHQLNFPLSKIPWQWEPNIQRRLRGVTDIGELLNHFALRSTPEAVNRALLNWSQDHYHLKLFFNIPSPREVLDQQIRGERCVTMFRSAKELSRLILGERDPLSFTMHDLIHADHFYHHNHTFDGQVDFYNFLYQCLEKNHFESLLPNEEFAREFDYLISDMNAYPVHLMKCLKSALVHYHPQKERFFQQWLRKLNPLPEEEKAFLALNTSDYQEELMDHQLLDFFARSRMRTL